MLNQVLFDLRVFLLFYFILLIIFSFIFAVLGVGNKNFGLYEDYYGSSSSLCEDILDIPNSECTAANRLKAGIDS
jgi:hypothetical protein